MSQDNNIQLRIEELLTKTLDDNVDDDILYQEQKFDIQKDINYQLSKFSKEKKVLLENIINEVYGKKTQLNFVDLKHYYLNSDILAQSLAVKLKRRKNNNLSVLRAPLYKVKLPRADKFQYD